MAVRPDHARRHHARSSTITRKKYQNFEVVGAEVEARVQMPDSCTADSEQTSCGEYVVHMTARQQDVKAAQRISAQNVCCTEACTNASSLEVNWQRKRSGTLCDKQVELRHRSPNACAPRLFAAAGAHDMKRNIYWQL